MEGLWKELEGQEGNYKIKVSMAKLPNRSSLGQKSPQCLPNNLCYCHSSQLPTGIIWEVPVAENLNWHTPSSQDMRNQFQTELGTSSLLASFLRP